MHLLAVLLLVKVASCEPNSFIEHRFPTPKIEDTYLDVEVEFLAMENGCMLRQSVRKAVVCLGFTCSDYPSDTVLYTTAMKIKRTIISVLKRDDFRNLHNVSSFIIEFNTKLHRIEPGCFRNLSTLQNLTISSNQNLKVLEKNVFEGLVQLKEIHLNKNGFTRVLAASQALSPRYLPALQFLSLNENFLANIFANDFAPMSGSALIELQMVLCQIDYIHPQSLNPLARLTMMKLGQNQFNVTVVTELFTEMNRRRIPLTTLSLYNAGFRRHTPMPLLEALAKSQVTQLNLGRNSFDNLNEDSFPLMPKLRALDLSSCLLLHIAPGTFRKIPNLESIFLAENILPNVPEAVLLPQLKDLDLSGNSGTDIGRSYLTVEDNTFEHMSALRSLRLSNNLLSTVFSRTFHGLDNLEYLSLRNASIFDIRPGAFSTLRRLKYLNIENNHVVYPFNSAVFEGLGRLETLLMGGCSHYNLSAVPSPFQHLQSLVYLGLENNQIDWVPSTAFAPLRSLMTLNLAQNFLTEWYNRLFANISLQELDISHNKIKFLTVPMLNDMQQLQQINIEGNPFSCDCSLNPMAKWLRTHNLSAQHIQHDDFDPQCVRSDTGEPVTLLQYIEYLKEQDVCADAPPLNKAALISLVSVLVAAGLILTVLGYVYRTHVRHWSLLARMAFRRYLCRDGDDAAGAAAKYKYDAFVSYSNEDQDFVINLVTMLENYEPFLKLCVYERDFQIGSGISESVLQSVAASRKTLLVISDAFAKSQWCRWEAKLAEHHHLFFKDATLKGSAGTLLMVMLDSVSDANMTPTLKYLLKTRIYLEWSGEPEKQALFWEKLRKKLTASTDRSFESQVKLQET